MVKLDVNIIDVDIDTLHQWFDNHAPGWSVELLKASSSSLAYSGRRTLLSVKWMKARFQLFRHIGDDGRLWIRYSLPTEASALLARLTWETRTV